MPVPAILAVPWVPDVIEERESISPVLINISMSLSFINTAIGRAVFTEPVAKSSIATGASF